MLIDLPDDLYPDFSSVRISAEHEGVSAPSSCAMQEAVASKHGSSAAQRHSIAGSEGNGGGAASYRGQQPANASGGAVRSGYGGPAAVPKPVLRPHAIPIRKPGEPAPSKATDSTSCGSSTSSTSSPPTPAVKPPAPAAPSAVKPPGPPGAGSGGARAADSSKQHPVGTAAGAPGSVGGSGTAPGDASKGPQHSGRAALAPAAGGATKPAPALPTRAGMHTQSAAAGPNNTAAAAGPPAVAGRGPAGLPGVRTTGPAGPPQPMGQGGAARPLQQQQQQHVQQQRCGPQPPPPPPRAGGGAAVHMGNRAGMGPMPVPGVPLRAAPGPLAGTAPASAAAAAAGPRAAPGIPMRSGGLLGHHTGVPGAQGPGRGLPRGPPAPLQLPRSSDGGGPLPSPAAACSAGATPTSARQHGVGGRHGPLGSSANAGDAAYGPQDVRAEAAGAPAAAAGPGRGLGPRSPVGPLPSPGHRGPLPGVGSAAAAAGAHPLARHMPNGVSKAGPPHLSGRHGCTVTVVPGSALQMPMRPGVVPGRPSTGMMNPGVSSQDVRAEAGLNRVGSGNSSSSSSSSTCSSSNGGPPAMRLAVPGAGPAAATGPVLKSPGSDPSTTAARAPPMLQPLRGMAREALASPPAGPWGPSYGPKHPAAGPSAGWGAQGQPHLGPTPGPGGMGPRGGPHGPPGSNHPSVLQPSTPQGRVAAPAGGPAASSVPKGARGQTGASSQDVRVADTQGHPGAAGPAYHAAAGGLLSPVGPAAPAGRAGATPADAGAKATPAPGALERQPPAAGGGKVKGPSMLQQHLRKLSQQVPGGHANQPAAPGTPRIQSHGKSAPAGPAAGAAPGAGQAAKAAQRGGVDQGRPGSGEGAGKGRKGVSGGAQAQPLLSMADATKRLLRAGEGAPVWVYLDAAGDKVGPCQGPELHARLTASKVDYDTLVCGFTHAPPPDARLMTAFFQPLQALVETVQAGGRYDPLVPGPARG